MLFKVKSSDMVLDFAGKGVNKNMVNAEETRRWKAKQIRYKRAIPINLNLDKMRDELCDIEYECDEVSYCIGDDDSLLDALDGDEDEVHEFRMMFADLSAECHQMQEDLHENYVPECFGDLLTGIGAGRVSGGLIGWDSYEEDYFKIDETEWAEDESEKRLMRMTKQDLLYACRYCFKTMYNYLALRDRYDSLKASMDILRSENTAYLKMVKEIDELYAAAEKEEFYRHSDAGKRFEKLLELMPQIAWLQ